MAGYRELIIMYYIMYILLFGGGSLLEVLCASLLSFLCRLSFCMLCQFRFLLQLFHDGFSWGHGRSVFPIARWGGHWGQGGAPFWLKAFGGDRGVHLCHHVLWVWTGRGTVLMTACFFRLCWGERVGHRCCILFNWSSLYLSMKRTPI